MAIPTWKMFPALLCGNACIFKPAEDVPHTGAYAVEIMLEAGLPPEVIQLVHGLGEAAGAAIVNHPLIPVISFTGSTETGRIVGETCGRLHKRLSLEMGGKNAMLRVRRRRSRSGPRRRVWGAFGTTAALHRHQSLVLQMGFMTRCSAVSSIAHARSARRRTEERNGRGAMINQGAVEKDRALRRHRAGGER